MRSFTGSANDQQAALIPPSDFQKNYAGTSNSTSCARCPPARAEPTAVPQWSWKSLFPSPTSIPKGKRPLPTSQCWPSTGLVSFATGFPFLTLGAAAAARS